MITLCAKNKEKKYEIKFYRFLTFVSEKISKEICVSDEFSSSIVFPFFSFV